MILLSDFEKDALSEIFNIGVGRAADAMSQLVGEKVYLSVPDVKLVSREQAVSTVMGDPDKRVCAISQDFKGNFETEAILMFAEERGIDIVCAMLHESLPFEEISAMEQEAISEIGNIILNSVMSTLGDMFHTEMMSSLPNFSTGAAKDILLSARSGGETIDHLILVHIAFVVERLDASGYLAFFLDVSSLEKLRECLAQLVESAGS